MQQFFFYCLQSYLVISCILRPFAGALTLSLEAKLCHLTSATCCHFHLYLILKVKYTTSTATRYHNIIECTC